MAVPRAKFLITGGQGFLGSYIAKSALAAKHEVVLFDVEPSNHILQQVLHHKQIPEITRVFGDISKGEDFYRVLKQAKPTHIIHLAALQIPGCRADPYKGAMVNVVGHINVFEAVKRYHKENLGTIENIVYASSAAVAGAIGDYKESIDDSTRHSPNTHYGFFKLCNEGNAKIYWNDEKISSVGLRPHTIYGVGREIGVTSGPSKAIKATVLAKQFQIPFKGKTSFLFVEDAADIFLKCAQTKEKGSFALNIAGSVHSAEDFVKELNVVLPDSKPLVEIAPNANELPLAFDFKQSGLEKLIGKFNYTPLREGIKKTAGQFYELKNLGLLTDAL